MCDVQALIDREQGNYLHFDYDNILKLLKVKNSETFYNLRNRNKNVNERLYQNSPVACQYAKTFGYERILALAMADGRVALHMTNNKEDTNNTIEWTLCHLSRVYDIIWMTGRMKFVTVSADRTACLWDVGMGDGVPQLERSIVRHTQSVTTAAFSLHSASLLATGARDGHVLVWDLRTASATPALTLRDCHSSVETRALFTRSSSLSYPPSCITGLAFRNEMSLLSCGECDGNIKSWDLRRAYSGYRRAPLPAQVLPYPGVFPKRGYASLLMDEGMRLYVNCMDDVIYRYNVATHAVQLENEYRGHQTAAYTKMCLSPDGEYLVSGSCDKFAYVWHVRRSQPVVRLAGHRGRVMCAAWSRGGDVELATCDDVACHKIWRIGGKDEAASGGHAELAAPLGLTPRAALASSSHRTPAKRRAPTNPTPPRRSLRLRQRALCAQLANLPDYIATGEAPHLGPTLPPKRRRSAVDWL